MGKVKGIAVVGAVRLLRSQKDKARELLPPELQHYLGERISTSTWYPAQDLPGLLKAASQLRPGSPDRALELMGEMTVRAQADVYRDLLLGGGSTSRTFALWSAQYDTGELRRIREAPNAVRFELTDFADTSREVCILMGGYFKGALTINGMADPNVDKLSCRLWGDEACAWRATWKKDESD